ncbi:MAG: ATP-binding cassette domain-containing protein, partial [Desulfovibrionaceae bacterium]
EQELGLPADPGEAAEARILALRVGPDPEQHDVVLPCPGLELRILMLRDIYVATSLGGDCGVTVGGAPLARGVSVRLGHNDAVRVGPWRLRRYDLGVFFENKVHPPRRLVWLDQPDLEPVWSESAGSADVAALELDGSHLSLRRLDPLALIKVGDELMGEAVGERLPLCLDQPVFVGGWRLPVREAFWALCARRESDPPDAGQALRLGNDVRCDLYLHDDLPRTWTARLVGMGGGRLRFEPGTCPYQAALRGRVVRGGAELEAGEELVLGGVGLRLDPDTRRLVRRRFGFNRLAVQGVSFRFDDGALGLDEIAFEARFGELLGIMGPSGSGKSTLLRVLAGILPPDSGRVLLDGADLHERFGELKDYLGYVPQEDLLLSNLTVSENLSYYARLRFPERGLEELRSRVASVLRDIGLWEKRHLKVGDATDKILSGGERKRLNIGLELLSDADIYMLDEPTSGLSSKDSEKIMELLAEISLRGKMVLAVVHQPGSRIYKLFDKILMLDNGGKLAFFGEAGAALTYFRDHLLGPEGEGGTDADAGGPAAPLEGVECPRCGTVQPHVLLDSLEESLRDIDGSVLGERKYSPDYWKRRFREHAVDAWLSSVALPPPEPVPPPPRLGVRARLSQFRTLVSRNFVSKLRDRANLLITFLEAPLLGAGVGFILRYAPGSKYSLYTNDLFATFLFVAVIVAIFLSLTNSVTEVIGDRALFLRERMINTTHRGYLGAKLVTLTPFALAQNVLFLAPGFLFLEVRELYAAHILFLTVASYAALAGGLCISSIPRLSARAALNVVPLVLVPQIILGGALVEYEKLNKSLTIAANSPVPEVCQLMPSRWAYEGMMVLQEAGNSYHDEHTARMEALKTVKYALAEAESTSPPGPDAPRLRAERDRLEADLEAFRTRYKYAYGNKRIHDAVTYGQEQAEDLAGNRAGAGSGNGGAPGPVFGPGLGPGSDAGPGSGVMASAASDLATAYPLFTRAKRLPFLGITAPTPIYDALVLFCIGLLFNLAALVLLRYQETLTRLAACLTRRRCARRRSGAR